MQELVEKALHAAEQNMKDVSDLWASGRTSDLVFGEAVRDMKRDGLNLVRQARAALTTPAAPSSLLCKVVGAGEPTQSPLGLLTNKVADFLMSLHPLQYDDAMGEDAGKVLAFAQAESLIEYCGAPSVGLLGEGEAELLAELTRLHGIAGAAPWRVEVDLDDDCFIYDGANELVATMPWVNSNGTQQDADLIIAMRNALPGLLARLATTEAPATPAVVEAGGGATPPLTLTDTRWVFVADTPELKDKVNELLSSVNLYIPEDTRGPRYKYVLWNSDRIDALYSNWTKPRWGKTVIDFEQFASMVAAYADSAPARQNGGSLRPQESQEGSQGRA